MIMQQETKYHWPTINN